MSTSGTTPKVRFTGIDAARGIALIGMMAIHVLPEVSDDYGPTWSWSLFAGKSAALFALLAGVTLALSAGGVRPKRGLDLAAVRRGTAVRAVIVGAIGLTVAYIDMPAFIILAYYGVMFLLAVPLLGLSARTLFAAAAGFAILGPTLMALLRGYLPAPGFDPTFTALFTDPWQTVTQLLLTGTYPAIPWMAYICAGLAIGRLRLGEWKTQTAILVAGAGTALAAALVSALLLGPLGGLEQIVAATPDMDTEAVRDVLIWGPSGYLPTTTFWWFAILAPHSTTPLDLLYTIGVAAAVLGAMLLLSRVAERYLLPLAAAGSMTLTLYTGHLLILGSGFYEDQPEVSLVLQVAAVIAFALIWRRFHSQGPLEELVGKAAGAARRRVLERGRQVPTAENGPGTS
ncbi:DUF1624 domain-containing protein [Arthrobacter sp. Sa2CUA1]|uniref:DUF1624 domain-containing protein n=1 Tax=Arthrobacter gallicola TaxID=2762225 RepID=A0ABR8UW64_9MICC|nr:heparan-alpha-glucosaminide N-acetyltransferase domain-containing protein [Arthrobacter gallicola]MBD7996331.1 DUF1624 domain-containing protein [Arthrobacter gallicola]